MASPQSGGSVGSDVVEGRHKKRVRTWTAEDRAKHRVLEKERREAFSDNLLLLARALPALADVKESRLSKHTIVEESFRYHQLQKNQLNQWRQCLSTVSKIEEPKEQTKGIPQHDETIFEDVPDFTGSGESLSTSFTTAGYDATVGSTITPAFISGGTAQIYNTQHNIRSTDVHAPALSSRSIDQRFNVPSTSFVPETTFSNSHPFPDNTQLLPMTVQPHTDSLIYAPEPSVFDRGHTPGAWDTMIQAFDDTTSWPSSAFTVPLGMHSETCL